MDLLEFLKSSQIGKMRSSIHEDLIDYLCGDLSLIKINGNFEVYREVKLEKTEGIRVGCVDIVVRKEPILYLIEGKVVGNLENDEKAYRVARGRIRSQLRGYHNFFLKNFNIDARCIGVYRSIRNNGELHYFEMTMEEIGRGRSR